MNKKYLTYIPRILTIFLILCILAVVVSIVNNHISAVQGIPNEPTSGQNENGGNQNQDDETPNKPEPYFTQFPKASSESQDFVFVQSLEGYGDIKIMNLCQTADFIYAVVETSSEFGDIQTDKSSVAVAMISPLGNIEKILVLPSRLPLSYLDFSFSSSGVVVLAKTEENILLYNLDLELNRSETTPLPYAQGARFFPAIEGTLILTEGKQNIVYKADDILKTGFLPAGEIVEIYDFYNYLLIFINSENGYHILKLSSSLLLLQETVVANCKALSVLPIIDQQTQKFAIVEKSGSKTALYKYDMTFKKQNSVSAELGTVENIELMNYINNILAVMTGEINAVYIFNAQLECALSSLFSKESIISIFETRLYNEAVMLLANTRDGFSLIEYRFDDTYSSFLIDDKKSDNARFVIRSNGNKIIFYDKLNEYGFYDIVIKAV